MKLLEFLKRLRPQPAAPISGSLAREFNNKFGYEFQKAELLLEALTHRSYIYCNSHVNNSSERLEFLGDSVLGLIAAGYMFKEYPEYHEGDLTKSKALLVNETTLSMIATNSGLNNMILMSPEEEKSGGRQRASIISDSVEAVIGAIYLDGGFDAARRFVYHLIIPHAADIFADSNQRNFKGELLEYLQRAGQAPPFYQVVSEEGPDHEKIFNVAVTAFGKVAGSGSGASKKEAEQKAAAKALESLLGHENKNNISS